MQPEKIPCLTMGTGQKGFKLIQLCFLFQKQHLISFFNNNICSILFISIAVMDCHARAGTYVRMQIMKDDIQTKH